MKNPFIVIEGIDGVGKTSIINELRLHSLFGRFIFTKEPYYPIKLSERDNVLNNMMLSHYWHLEEVIYPNLHKKPIICDRYISSRIAYQCEQFNSFEEGYDEIMKLHSLSPLPDYVIFIECPIEIVKERMKSRRGASEYDTDYEYLERVQQNYYELMKKTPNYLQFSSENVSAEIIADIIYNTLLRG